jgi:hypothetical protein
VAANVVGAFTVIDRASRPIRKIRDEAIKADAAVAKLGGSLDRVGTQQQRSRLDSVSGNMRKIAKEGGTATGATKGLNKELDKAGAPRKAQGIDRSARAVTNTARAADTADRSMKRLDSSSKKSERSLRSLGGTALGAGVALKVALIPAVGLAVQGVAALGVGVASLLPSLSSFLALAGPLGAGIAGMGVAMITAKLATNDLSKAMSGNKAALKGLTPEAREFVRTLKQYMPLMKDLRREAQRGLFPGLDLALRRIVRAAPVVQSVLRNMGGTLGGIAANAARFGTRRGFLRDFEMLAGQGGTLLQRGSRVLMNLADAFRHVSIVAMPFTDWLSKSVEGWSGSIKGAALMGRETGHLAQWFRQARTDLEQFGRIGRNVFGGVSATLQELRPLGDLAWRSIERLTERWSQWAQSTGGRTDMRRYFAQMAPALRQIGGLAGDLGGALGRLSAGTGFTASVRALRDAVPALERGLSAMAEGLGPQLVGALSQVVELFGTLSQHGGALSQVVGLLGGVVGAFNWLFQHVPALGTVIATALSVSAISRFAGMLTTLAGRWRAVGSAAATAGAAQATAGAAGAGGAVAGGALGAAARQTGRTARFGGPALLAGAVGASVAGQAVGGGAGNALSGAGTGAMLGATVGSAIAPGIGTAIGAGIGAIGGGAIGYFTGRSAGQRSARATGQDQALEMLAGGANARQIRGRVGDIQGRLNARTPGTAYTPVAGTPTGGAPGRLQVTGGERRRLQAQLDALRPALKVQVQLERQQAVRAAQDAGSRLAAGLGQAFNVYNRRFGLNKSMRMLRSDVMREMAALGPVGRKQMGQNVIDWARGQARENPKMWGQVRRLTRRIESEFNQMGQRVKIVNGRILDGSRQDWARIETALANPAEKARERISTAFTRMQAEAATALTLMGFSRRDANAIIRTSEWTGGDIGAAQGAVASGQRYTALAKTYTNKKARGGRIGGSGLMDTVPVAPGVVAAPGEMIVNRHTERRLDQKLAAFGTSLGREVASENKPHFAAYGSDMARVGARSGQLGGGGGLQQGIAHGVQAVLAHFPGLSVTSTTGAGHASGSYHYRGMAADLGGAGPLMNRAASWIGSTMGASLLEGIHNPNLSIKNGQVVPPGSWGAKTWAQHANHIHMAMGGGGAWAGLPGGNFGGGGGLGNVRLHGYRTGIRGVAGAGADKMIASGGRAFEARINEALGGAGAATAGGNLTDWLTQALRITGQYSPANLAGLTRMAMQESGGDPSAIQRINDVNMRQGNPARGLLQTIPQTFNAYKLPGYGNIMDPVSNAIASIRYQMSRYGHIVGHGGYALGGRVPDWGGWHAGGGRMRFDRPTMIGVGEGGVPEDVTVTPARGRGGAGGGAVLNVHPGAIVVNGAGRGATDIADEVMSRLVTIIRGMGLEPEEAIS